MLRSFTVYRFIGFYDFFSNVNPIKSTSLRETVKREKKLRIKKIERIEKKENLQPEICHLKSNQPQIFGNSNKMYVIIGFEEYFQFVDAFLDTTTAIGNDV